MHLVIYFSGTSNPGNDFIKNLQYKYIDSNNVSTMFVAGCQDSKVCNAEVFPNLAEFSERFVGEVFETYGDENKSLKINENCNRFYGKGFPEDHKEEVRDEKEVKKKFEGTLKTTEITGITLCGLSRGAVTCFHVVKELNKIAPHIPVNIVANQPVPGELVPFRNTNKADCSKLRNLKNVTTILGSYTGKKFSNLPSENRKKLFLSEVESNSDWEVRHLLISTGINPMISEDKPPFPLTKEERDNFRAGDIIFRLIYPKTGEMQNSKLMSVEFDGEKYYPRIFGINEIRGLNKLLKGEKDIAKVNLNKVRKKISSACGMEESSKSTTLYHKMFFSQVVPSLPPETKEKVIVIPLSSHFDGGENTGMDHLHMEVAKNLKKSEGASDDLKKSITKFKEIIKANYVKSKRIFSKKKSVQRFFSSMKKNQILRHKDQLHPLYTIKWDQTQTNPIMTWWKLKEKDASKYSSKLTKELVSKIKSTTASKIKDLIALSKVADKWLVDKALSGKKSSRYLQVTQLRDKINAQLRQIHIPLRKTSLKEQIRSNKIALRHGKHFLQQFWIKRSKAASYFKSQATRDLEKAINIHAESSTQDLNNDETLLKAVNAWLKVKTPKTKSKR